MAADFQFASPWAHETKPPGGRPMALTDMGNAERFAVGNAGDVKFLHQTRQWHVWDGTRFAVDRNGEAKRRAKQTVRAMLLEASLQDNEELRKEIVAHQIRSESDRAVRAMLALAESDEQIAACADNFDRDSLLFNLKNGTLNLRTGELREHDRADLITKLAPVEFDSHARAATWNRFLGEIMDGDGDKVAFLRRAVGYSLTGDVSEHCFFLLHGAGANGKSTLIEVLRALFGDYAMQADFQTFLASKGNGTRNDIARLRGARLVTAVESDAGKRLAENIVKHLTGGDTVTARFLYTEHFEFAPAFKLWMATNNKPRIFGTDDAIWRRVRLIPFSVTIPEERRDAKLVEKLKDELPGILNWALAGLAEWRERGLAAPRAVTEASEQYRQGEDAIGRFCEDKLVVDLESQTSASALYAAYREWCERTGEYQIKERDFSEELARRGFAKKRFNTGRVWLSIRLES